MSAREPSNTSNRGDPPTTTPTSNPQPLRITQRLAAPFRSRSFIWTTARALTCSLLTLSLIWAAAERSGRYQIPIRHPFQFGTDRLSTTKSGQAETLFCRLDDDGNIVEISRLPGSNMDRVSDWLADDPSKVRSILISKTAETSGRWAIARTTFTWRVYSTDDSPELTPSQRATAVETLRGRDLWLTDFKDAGDLDTLAVRDLTAVKPIPSGYVVNSISLAMLITALWCVPAFIRWPWSCRAAWRSHIRRRRIARSLCPACSYPLAGLATCPECGKQTTTT